jgi:tRNA A-37 threonylcarbamoyl transferase component Bud32/thiol-disulfide isomerase/thioredoxin
LQPKQIGQYQIRRLIASGGMGTVYEAIQQNPRRTVAVKVIAEAVASDETAERLKYEAQLLARLQHPGIAEIYEAGTYEEGGKTIPFFAMEYIANARSITGYANEKELKVRERLALFTEVCEAVHHGHLRGVVHRDLKPANILVDSSGRVRIIDFGIARATDADLRRTTSLTEVGQLVGSAAYMSPEQFEADPRDIDARSDVYALGVLLYELLAGVLPYDVKSKSIFELAAMVREERPALLGTHDKALKGDLETIVDKALQKDRDQRYESAHALASDIQRYLSGEAITARTPSLGYHVRVLVRRHKIAMGSMAAVFMLLVAGFLIVSRLYVQVDAESNRAQAAQAFLTNALSAAAPRGWGEGSVTEMYDKVSAQLDSAFPGEPVMEAEVRQLLGLAYFGLSRFEEADQHLTKTIALRKSAVGEYHEKTLEAMEHLNFLYSAAGRLEDRSKVRHDIWKWYEHESGVDHESTLSVKGSWIHSLEDTGASDALELAFETVEMWKGRYGGEHKGTLEAQLDYARLLLFSGQVTESEALARTSYDRVMQKYDSDAYLVRHGRRTLAATLLALGRTADTKGLYEHWRLPPDMVIEEVFQGTFDPQAAGTQVLVFWEAWCPFCILAFPILEDVQQDYSDLGLNVVGVTSAEDGKAVEKVRSFLRDERVSFTNVQGLRPHDDFYDFGIPYTWVLHNGELVWEGNPLDTKRLWKYVIKGLARPDSSVVLGQG